MCLVRFNAVRPEFGRNGGHPVKILRDLFWYNSGTIT